jgi:signal transduction histidine kinase
MNRGVLFYLFLASIAGIVVVLNVLAQPYDASHPDQVINVAYLFLAGVLLNLADVRLDRGHLTLGGIVMVAAAILTNPLDATLVGLSIALGQAPRGVRAILANATIYGAIAVIAATVASLFHSTGELPIGPRLLAALAVVFSDIGLVAIALSITSRESIRSILSTNFSRSFSLALAYLSLAGLLMSYVLDGSLLGYFLATIVCVLSLALTDTIAGRRVRRVLESELSDADRHLFHSRAVEGVVHNLRNHMANALGYLREIDTRRLDPVDRESLETATGAANDAVTVLRGLSQGATPRVTYAIDPVDLNELVTRALGMARPRARTKEVQLAVRETPDVVNVRADPLLMREVITNLLNNAIDAVDQGGRVEATTGRRGNGWPYLSIADNGPGISDDQRRRLFEPHFTTKEGGTGLGLFMSYGIVREHRGQLLFEGNRRGAVFTVTLPPFGSEG